MTWGQAGAAALARTSLTHEGSKVQEEKDDSFYTPPETLRAPVWGYGQPPQAKARRGPAHPNGAAHGSALEEASRCWSFGDQVRSGARLAQRHVHVAMRSSVVGRNLPAAWARPCDRRQLTVLGSRPPADGPGSSPSLAVEGAPPSEEVVLPKRTVPPEGPRLAPPAQLCRRAAQVERDPRDALRGLPGPRPSRSPELAGGGGSERVGDDLGSWPHRWCSPCYATGRRAACGADQRAQRRRRAVCRGRDGR